jgi:hypothetical protein
VRVIVAKDIKLGALSSILKEWKELPVKLFFNYAFYLLV